MELSLKGSLQEIGSIHLTSTEQKEFVRIYIDADLLLIEPYRTWALKSVLRGCQKYLLVNESVYFVPRRFLLSEEHLLPVLFDQTGIIIENLNGEGQVCFEVPYSETADYQIAAADATTSLIILPGGTYKNAQSFTWLPADYEQLYTLLSTYGYQNMYFGERLTQKLTTYLQN